jgi:hypothetical protein
MAEEAVRAFGPMTIEHLAADVAEEADADRRWRLLLEFLEELLHMRRRTLTPTTLQVLLPARHQPQPCPGPNCSDQELPRTEFDAALN